MPAPVQWGNPRVIDPAANNFSFKMMALPNGSFVGVWVGGNGPGLRIQSFNLDGSARGEDVRMPGENGDNAVLGMTVLSDGGYVVSWAESRLVKGTIFNADGTVRQSGLTLSKDAQPFGVDSSVAALKNGGFMVLYRKGQSPDADIKGRTFSATGQLIKDEFAATGIVVDDQYRAQSVQLPNGNVALLYRSESDGPIAAVCYLRILKPDGTPANASADILISDEYVNDPSITVLRDGRIVVVWNSPGGDIKARIFQSDGTLVGDELSINSTTTGSQQFPVVSALADGGFAVAWHQTQALSEQQISDVRVATFDAAGVRQSDDILAHAPSDGRQTFPKIITLADGRFVVSWLEATPTDARLGSISAQIFDPRFAAVDVKGTSGNDQYYGTNMHGDILRGEGGNDTLWGADGDDVLQGGAGADELMGGNGIDMAHYGSSSQGLTINMADLNQNSGDARGDSYNSIEMVAGSEHADLLIGDAGNNWLFGLGSGAGRDTLQGGGGNDTLNGGAGSDELDGGSGADSLVGGAGWDVASYITATAGVKIDLGDTSQNTGHARGDVYLGIEAFSGSALVDTILGDGDDNELYGHDGDDHLVGAGGNDWLRGDAGNDILQGGLGNDTLIGSEGEDQLVGEAGNDSLQGGAGNDTLSGGTGNDTLDGSTGVNTAVFTGARDQYAVTRSGDTVTVAHANGTDTDVLKNIRMLEFAGRVTETFNVAPTDLRLSNASIAENAPLGAVVGTLSASDGDGDALTYSLAPGSSSAFAIVGTSLVVRGPLDFETKPQHQVTLQASDGYGGVVSQTVTLTVTNDTGETTPFTLRGTPGVDTLRGEAGHDTIYGSAGHDTLSGEAGDDRIFGGLGNDRLYGGVGKDVFVFDTKLNKSSNVDRIMDFRTQDDSLWLDNKYFTKLGSGSLSKPKKFKADMFTEGKKAKDAEDRIVYDKKTGALYYDADGTGSKAQVKFATIATKTKLAYHDFFVI